MPLRYPFEWGLKMVYLSFAGISCSFGSSNAFSCARIAQYKSVCLVVEGTDKCRTSDAALPDNLDDFVDAF